MIEKTVLLACTPERAFELLTEEAGLWWPPSRRHTQDPESTIRMEPGGRFFERAHDGTEVELGIVRVFEPSRRLVLDWYPGTGPDQPTVVEMRLEAEGAGTRLHLSHQSGPRSRDAYEQKAQAFENSWTLVFAALEAHLGLHGA